MQRTEWLYMIETSLYHTILLTSTTILGTYDPFCGSDLMLTILHSDDRSMQELGS